MSESKFVDPNHGMRSVESDEWGGPLWNDAGTARIEATIKAATGEDVPWLAVNLAVILDRAIRADEALGRGDSR